MAFLPYHPSSGRAGRPQQQEDHTSIVSRNNTDLTYSAYSSVSSLDLEPPVPFLEKAVYGFLDFPPKKADQSATTQPVKASESTSAATYLSLLFSLGA